MRATNSTYKGKIAALLAAIVTIAVAARVPVVSAAGEGITWTTQTAPVNRFWTSVTYGNGLFVAVAASGTGNRVMTSPDGITWTARTSAADNDWQSVTFGNGLFVAVGITGTGNRVMTSPDGITWTARTSAADNNWVSVTYGNGLFVAVGITMTTPRATRTMSAGAAPKLSFHVPAAAHTSSYCNRSGSTNTRNLVL